ncbi:Cell wall assembly regulator, variant 2 [Orbilia brochopaga]|uniref:Cell wall assembly regulator, variant 2 n=1 Tax=Orbilia brochopaga TaxID=3140254 RepID=A0AAV9UXR0_9PEZI
MDINSGFANAMKTFWHAMTSDDRHATFNSPYRAASSYPGVGRNPELSSVSSSRLDGAPYQDELGQAASRSSTHLASSAADGNDIYSPRSANGPLSPSSPYSPGSRSSTTMRPKDVSAITGIPLQEFNADGSPPPPPVAHSWRRIDRWAEDNYPELFDQLCEGSTINDINELEHDLDCSLPMDVRESLQIHDGQERGGTPTGIIFGAMLMDCEEILDEWKQWQVVRAEYLQKQATLANGASAGKPQAGPSSGPSSPRGGAPPNGSTLNKAVLMARQDSQPEGAVQKVYCHPGWIPLVRDWGGNNIGIDLAPGPAGKWGQVIMFGRDYDCKYVVAKSWASFLATVADDLDGNNWYVEEESGELKLRELKTTKVEPGYFDILRLRTDKKYGRKIPPHMRRRPGPPPHVATGGNGPVGPRPGPGTISPSSPMIGLSPIIRPDGTREPMPSKSLSPIHAPKAVRPIGRALEDMPSSATASSNPGTPVILTPSRTSLQSTRSTETPPPLVIDKDAAKKKDDLEDLSDLISTPTTSKSVDGEKMSPGGKESSKEVDSLAETMEDVDLGKGK